MKRNGTTGSVVSGLLDNETHNIIPRSSSVSYCLSSSEPRTLGDMGVYLRNNAMHTSSIPRKNSRNRNKSIVQTSPSDSHLFSGRKPRPLSLPPNGIPRYSVATSLPYAAVSSSASSTGDFFCNDNNHNQSKSKYISDEARKSPAYTQKFPVSYSTPGISSLYENISRLKQKTGDNNTADPLIIPDHVKRSVNSERNLSYMTSSSSIRLQNDNNNLYKSNECPRYSFHSLPISDRSDLYSRSISFSKIEDDHATKKRNVYASLATSSSLVQKGSQISPSLVDLNDGKYEVYRHQDNSQLRRSGSLKLSRNNGRGSIGSAFAMSSSRSFTNGSTWADVCNTLPRSGKQKSGEQLALFLDIMTTQERFVKVSEF